MSRLRDFISENRREFDEDAPSSALWDNIEAGMSDSPKKSGPGIRPGIWLVAASLVFLAGITWFLLPRTHTSDVNPTTILNTEENGFSVEVKKMFLQINEQQRELKSLGADAPELYKRFQHDLTVLDSTYADLERQAATAQDPDIILSAMLQNLQVQAGLLKKQLQILNEYNKNQNRKNEKNKLRTT